MKLVALLFAMFWCQIMAFNVENAKLTYTLNKESKTVKIDSFEDKSLPKLVESLTVDDIVKFSFKLNKYHSIPEQIELLVGLPERDLEIPIKPTLKTKDDSVFASFKLSLKDLPQSILYFANKEEKPITGTVIVASSEVDMKENVFSQVFNLELNLESFNFDSFQEPLRFEALPEIHYLFASPPKTVTPLLAQLFAIIILVAGAGLFLSWISTGVTKFDNIPRGSNFLYLIGLIATIVGFEFIFFNYYLGTSIFDTINASIVLGIFGLIVGTKYLRNIGSNI